jgi:hypothetical protein
VFREGVRSRFEALPDESKLFVSAATSVGAMLGILIGLIFPRGIAALSTAGVGAAGMLVAAILLAITMRSTGAMQLAQEPLRLLAPWAALTVIGLWMQRCGGGAHTGKRVIVVQPPAPPMPARA